MFYQYNYNKKYNYFNKSQKKKILINIINISIIVKVV